MQQQYLRTAGFSKGESKKTTPAISFQLMWVAEKLDSLAQNSR